MRIVYLSRLLALGAWREEPDEIDMRCNVLKVTRRLHPVRYSDRNSALSRVIALQARLPRGVVPEPVLGRTRRHAHFPVISISSATVTWPGHGMPVTSDRMLA